jgi:hypothetical protein
MRDWKFYDWIAYCTIFVVAIIEAIEGALHFAPETSKNMPDFLKSEWFAFLPLLLVSFATIVLLVGVWGSRRSARKHTPRPLQEIVKRTYAKGEIVTLDNCAFYDCTFDQSTFRWHGGPCMLSNPKIVGGHRFESTHVGIISTIDLMRSLNFLEPEFAKSWSLLPPSHFKQP